MTDLLPILAAVAAGGVALLGGLASLRAEGRAEGAEGSSPRSRHRGPSSGTILAVATSTGVLAIGAPTARMFGLLGIGLLLGGAGLLADRGLLRPAYRLVAEGAAGVAGVIVGLDTGITAIGAANALLVAVFVVVTVESLRLLDSAPRAGAAVAAPLAVALTLMATFAGTGQAEAVLLAAALAGALVGSLVAGATRPFWLGESGCLFGGFFLAALLVDLPTSTPAPLNVVVVLPLVAVPFFNAAVVALARLRRRRLVTQRHPDGLAHRLGAMPLSWPKAIALLGGLQALVGVAVVLADRGDLPVATPALAAMVSVAVLVVPTVAGKGVYRHRAVGLSRTVRLAALGVTVVAAAAVVPGALALVTARGEVALGVASAEGGLEAARRGEIEPARLALAQAESAMTAAHQRLANPLTNLGLAVPVLGPHLAAGRVLTGTAAELAATGAAVAGSAPQQLVVVNAAVPLDDMRRLRPELERGATALARAQSRAGEAELAYLLPSLRTDAIRLTDSLSRAAADADLALEAVTVLPALFGADGPRNYFVALQNLAEQRGSGGLVGNFAQLSVTDGQMDLVRTGRAAELNAGVEPAAMVQADLPAYLDRLSGTERPFLWQDITLSPDFPSVASAIEALYPRHGGVPVDGVLSLDTLALAALLELTGPVSVPEWPVPIGVDNAADILLRQQYLILGEESLKLERVEFLDSLVAATFDRIEAGALPPLARIAEVLGPMVAQGRIQLHSTVAEEQAFFERLGADGALPSLGHDSLLVVTNNSGGNKIDIFLDRSLSYRARFDPETGQMTASAEITLHNRAPDQGLPDYVIGSGALVESPLGTNRLFLSLYTPLGFEGATLDGTLLPMGTLTEQGRNVHSAFVSIPPGGTSVVVVELSGRPGEGPDYRLDLGHQPTIVADRVDVAVEPAEGWRATQTDGLVKVGDGASGSTTLDVPRSFSVGFRRR